jgi:hypothetical protein
VIRRKVLTVRLLTVALCCFVLLSAFVGCRNHHDTEAFYATRVEAEKSGEFSRGWLPDFLPSSSRSIDLGYDLSPSQVWCAFDFDVADKDAFLSSVKSIDRLAPPITQVPSPHVKWWPKSLEGNLDAQKIRENGFALYSATRPATQVENETWIFAINWAKGRGYFFGR